MDNIEEIKKRLLVLDQLVIWEKHEALAGYVMVILHKNGKVFGMAIEETNYHHWAAVEEAALYLYRELS